ncbi:hypothetical protein [Azospirillum largimobile]
MQALGQPTLAGGGIQPIQVLAHLPQFGFHPPLFSGLILPIRPNRLAKGGDEGRHHVLLHQPIA